MEDVLERCIALTAKSKGIPAEGLSASTTFEEIGADSLDKINLSFAVEETFDLNIPDQELGSLRTIGDMATGVEKLLAEKARSAETGAA